MANIPKGLGTIEDLFKRAAKAEQNWQMWRSLHQEAYDYSMPQRDTFRVWATGQRKNRHVFDDTAIDGLVTFANRVQGSVFPSWTQWMDLVSGNEIPEDQKDKTDAALEIASVTFFKALDHSNFSSEITPALADWGIGTGAIQIDEGDFDGDPIRIKNVPLAELHPEKPPRGPIVNVWRPQKVEARHIKELWPTADLPQSLENIAKKDPYKDTEILNGHLYNQKDKLYHHLVLHKDSKTCLFAQSFNEKRLIVFRYHLTPGEVFGRGPILQKLSDIRTANKVKQFLLENAAIQIAGIYTGRDDGIFNPYTVRIAPGTVIPVGANGTNNPSLQALPRAGDIGLGEGLLTILQDSIKKSLMVEPLGEVTDPVKSATEQMLRYQENLRNRGAAFGRLKTELVEPLVAAIVDILQGLGRLPEMKVNGKEVAIKHNSPLAKAEDQEDFANSQMWWQMCAGLPEYILAASVKIESLPKYWAKKLGVPADLTRDDQEQAALGQMVSDMATQQIQQQTG